MHVTISSPIPLPTPAAAAPDTDSIASVAASHLDDVSNRPRLSRRFTAFADGLLQRFRSGLASMLDRVGNLLGECLPQKKAAPMPAHPAIDRRAENLAWTPDHRWYWVPHMQPWEALVFKLFDSDPDATQFTAHSAFEDPNTPPDAPPRQSIEVRTIAYL